MIEITDKYIIIKILFIKITFKKKAIKSYIDAIVWCIPFKNLRNAIRNIYYEYKNSFNQINQKHQTIENIFLEYYIQNNKNNIAKNYNEFIEKLFNYKTMYRAVGYLNMRIFLNSCQFFLRIQNLKWFIMMKMYTQIFMDFGE